MRQFSGAPEPSLVIGVPGYESELAGWNVVSLHRARLVRSVMFWLIIDQTPAIRDYHIAPHEPDV